MNPIILFIGVIVILLLYLLIKNNKNNINEKLDDAMEFGSEKEHQETILTPKQIRYQKIDVDLMRAGIPLKAHEYIRFRYFSLLIVLGLLYILTKNYVVALLFTVGWWFVPPIAVKFAQDKKRNSLEVQIPPALSLIRNSLEAGMSFLQAMEIVAEEMDPPISEEFGRVLHETKVGKDLGVALNNMLERCQSQELKLVVVAVLIQREVGGNLGDIIDVILETIKDRVQIKGEIKTLTAQGRLSAVIICALPIVLGILMSIINPTYMAPLLTTFAGQVILGIAGFFEILGIYFISRIIKIDF